MGVSSSVVNRWRSNPPDTINDPHLFALLFLVLKNSDMQIDWVDNLISQTSVPIYQPFSAQLLSAYLEKVEIRGSRLPNEIIDEVISRAFRQYTAKSIINPGDKQPVILEKLVPLEPIATRQYIQNANTILMTSMSLYRFIPSFKSNFMAALRKGTQIKVLIVHPDSPAIDMMSLRSSSGTSINKQRRDIKAVVDELKHWLSKIPQVPLEFRLIDYMLPYGITIYENENKSLCRVRPIPFRAPTSDGPLLSVNSIDHEHWYGFFRNQFENLWEAGKIYSLE